MLTSTRLLTLAHADLDHLQARGVPWCLEHPRPIGACAVREEQVMDPELTAVFREMLREFVATEIAVGMTFAGIATTEYAQERPDRGHEVMAKAEQAYAEAERRWEDAEARGWKVTALRKRLRHLRETMHAVAVRRPSAE